MEGKRTGESLKIIIMKRKALLIIGALLLCFHSCKEGNQGDGNRSEEGAIRETNTEGMEQAKDWELKGVQESPDSLRIEKENSTTDTVQRP
tara:strand:- start:149621 stop:149893 length:273 start_codon:yes stop_codon:yes gene_type:complete